jgi:hypothetical protein
MCGNSVLIQQILSRSTLKKFGSPMPVFAYTTEDSYIPFLVVAWTMSDGGVNAVFARRRTSSSYT